MMRPNPSCRTKRGGFTLIELLVGMVLVFVVGSTLATLLATQMRFQRTEDTIRDSRSTARSALDVLRSDMRMLPRDGGLVSADADELVLRVPYAFGVVCSSTATQTDVSLLPTEPLTYASAALSGWAWRDWTTGNWTYEEGGTTVSEPSSAACDAASVEILTGGRTVRFEPGVTDVSPGTPIMMFQRIGYRFDESTALPGREALYRTVVETAEDVELVAPFSESSRFRFHQDWAAAEDDPPADLSDVLGIEIRLDAESVTDAPRSSEPAPFELRTSIFFKNVPL